MKFDEAQHDCLVLVRHAGRKADSRGIADPGQQPFRQLELHPHLGHIVQPQNGTARFDVGEVRSQTLGHEPIEGCQDRCVFEIVPRLAKSDRREVSRRFRIIIASPRGGAALHQGRGALVISGCLPQRHLRPLDGALEGPLIEARKQVAAHNPVAFDGSQNLQRAADLERQVDSLPGAHPAEKAAASICGSELGPDDLHRRDRLSLARRPAFRHRRRDQQQAGDGASGRVHL